MNTLSKIEKFEDSLRTAIHKKYEDLPEDQQKILVEHHLLIDIMNGRKLYEVLTAQNNYPPERIELLSKYFFDIKLQLYFIEVDVSSYNRLIYLPHQGENITVNPRLHLIHLSLDQSIILKSRIAWERFTNFIFYLETGEILDDKKTNSKSKSKVFEEFVKNNKKWSFLIDYLETIKRYDQLLRTPEVHKSSTICKYFIESQQIDSDTVLAITNVAMNLWPSIIAIIQGSEVIRGAWGIGMDKLKTPNPAG